MKVLSADETTAMLNRVIESQAQTIAQLRAELQVVNPDLYLAKVQAYSDGYHDGFGDGRDAERLGADQ